MTSMVLLPGFVASSINTRIGKFSGAEWAEDSVLSGETGLVNAVLALPSDAASATASLYLGGSPEDSSL